MADIPEEAIGAADAAVSNLPCDNRFERDRWRMVTRVALEAAAPHILAAAAARLKAEIADEATAICTEAILEAAAAERERIRQQLDDIATGFEHSHKPATEKCTHAEGIRYAISCLSPAEPEPVAVMCGLPGCRPGEHPYDPAVCGEPS